MDNKKTDQWLRSSIEDYQPVPSGEGRLKFLGDASKVGASSSHNGKQWWTAGLILLLLATASGVLFFLLEHKPMPQIIELPLQPATTQNNAAAGQTIENLKHTESAIQLPQSNDEPSIKKVNGLSTTSQKGYAPETQKRDTKSSAQLLKFEQNTEDVALVTMNAMTNKTVQESVALEEDNSNEFVPLQSVELSDDIQVAEPVASQIDTLGDTLMPVEKKSKLSTAVNSQKHLAYSIFYRPEVTYNLIESNKLSHIFGLDIQYRFFGDRYSVRTGLGLSVSKGYYEYATEYQEFLGEYEKLDSITFAWDEPQYHLMPTKYMSNEEVFEDTLSTSYSQIDKKHYYLEIPLILGYDFISNKTWRLGLRTGPRLSLLMQTKILNDMEDLGRNKVIQINQITSERINANWQFVGAVNLGIYTKGRIFFEIEPQFTYYFNSVYENADKSISPWSLSMRLAIGFK
jgi:hypothetical protein